MSSLTIIKKASELKTNDFYKLKSQRKFRVVKKIIDLSCKSTYSNPKDELLLLGFNCRQTVLKKTDLVEVLNNKQQLDINRILLT